MITSWADTESPSPIFRARRAVLVPGPVHHAAPFSACFQGLFGGSRVVLMRRFDALDPYKDAVATVAFDQARDPLSALASACQLRRSMALMLEAAGLAAGGARGVLRIKGLALVYLASLRVWLKDESADKARTMAALDKQLRRAESLVLRLSGRRRPGRAEAQAEGDEETAEA